MKRLLLPFLLTALLLWQWQTTSDQAAHIAELRQEVADLQLEMANDDAIFIMAFGADWNRGQELRSTAVTVTCYTSRVEECDDTPHITADGSTVRVGIIAVSNDLRQQYGLKFGQRVFLPGYGMFEVRDTMNSRWLRRVDVWMQDVTAAKMHGVKFSRIYWFV